MNLLSQNLLKTFDIFFSIFCFWKLWMDQNRFIIDIFHFITDIFYFWRSSFCSLFSLCLQFETFLMMLSMEQMMDQNRLLYAWTLKVLTIFFLCFRVSYLVDYFSIFLNRYSDAENGNGSKTVVIQAEMEV